jgi:hypothetical protein
MRPRLIFGLFILLLAACSGEDAVTSPTGVYRPPTQAVTSTTAPDIFASAGEAAAAEEPRPTPEPLCTNALWFMQDLTIPDGTLVQPGEKLDKRWQVQNAGSCNWDENYQVRLIAGPNMGVPQNQALFPALSGTEVTIRMNLIAPQEPGSYRSAWQAYSPEDEPFGDPFFIDIVVESEAPQP